MVEIDERTLGILVFKSFGLYISNVGEAGQLVLFLLEKSQAQCEPQGSTVLSRNYMS
jgi:hypothetical protein